MCESTVHAPLPQQIEGVDLPLLDGTLDSLEEGEESQGDSQEEGTSTLMEVDSISTQVGLDMCRGGSWGVRMCTQTCKWIHILFSFDLVDVDWLPVTRIQHPPPIGYFNP